MSATIVYAFLISVITPFQFEIGGIVLTSSRLLIILVLPIIIIYAFRVRPTKPNVTDYLFLFYTIWIGISLYENNRTLAVQNWGSNTVDFMGAYAIGRICIRTEKDFSSIQKFLLWFVAITFPFAIMESQTGTPIVLMKLKSLTNLVVYSDVYHEQRLGLWRSQVILRHPIFYGLICASAFSLTYIGLRNKIKNARRYTFSSLVVATTFLSLSSGPFLSLIIQIMTIIWRRATAGISHSTTILIALTIAFYIVIDVVSSRTPLEVMFTYATFSEETGYWRRLIFIWGVENIKEHPIVGVGLNEWTRPWFMKSGSMDNFWLLTAVSFGLPAFLLLISGYCIQIYRVAAATIPKNSNVNNWRLAWLTTFIGVTFVLSTVHVWENMYSYTFFLFGAGSWLLEGKIKVDSQNQQLEAIAVKYSRFEKRTENS